MQLNPLTIQDALRDQTVIINIRVNADNNNRDGRSVLVTAGVSGQVPVMLSGKFSQLNQLIERAWREFGQNSHSPAGANKTAGNTIASAKVTPIKKSDQKKQNKESILSLF